MKIGDKTDTSIILIFDKVDIDVTLLANIA